MFKLKSAAIVAVVTGGAIAVGGVAAAADGTAQPGQRAMVTDSSSMPAPAPVTAGGIGSTDSTGPFEVTLLAVEDPVPYDEFFEPEPGKRYVGVELNVVNTSAEPQMLSTLMSSELVDSAGQTWSTSLFALSDRSTLDGQIPAGESRRGWVGYEVPEESTGLRLFVDGDFLGDGEPATFSLDATVPAAAPSDPATAPSDPAAAPTTAPADPVSPPSDGGAAGVGETATTGAFEITMLSVEDPLPPSDLAQPEPGNRFVGAELEVHNTAAGIELLSMLLSSEVVDSAGQTWTPAIFATADRETADGEFAADETRTGWVAFEVPESATGLRLTVDADIFGDSPPATFNLGQ